MPRATVWILPWPNWAVSPSPFLQLPPSRPHYPLRFAGWSSSMVWVQFKMVSMRSERPIYAPSRHLEISPWYNRNGWLGVKHQVTYLPLEISPTLPWANWTDSPFLLVLTMTTISFLTLLLCHAAPTHCWCWFLSVLQSPVWIIPTVLQWRLGRPCGRVSRKPPPVSENDSVASTINRDGPSDVIVTGLWGRWSRIHLPQ